MNYTPQERTANLTIFIQTNSIVLTLKVHRIRHGNRASE